MIQQNEMDRTAQNSVAINIRDIPRGLRQKFKVQCARDGMTMTDKIVELIEDFVRKKAEAAN